MNLKKLIVPILIVILVASLIAGWFCWFQWRPAEIRKECYKEAKETAREEFRKRVDLPPGEPTAKEKIAVEHGAYYKDDYDEAFEMCLHKKGLK